MLDSLIRVLEWLVNASVGFADGIRLRFSELIVALTSCYYKENSVRVHSRPPPLPRTIDSPVDQ